MLSRSWRKWATWDFSFSVRGSVSGRWKAWEGVSGGVVGEDGRAKYWEERCWLGLVEVQLGIPGKIYPADSVDVAFAFFLDAWTLSWFSSSGHVVDVLSR